MKMDTLGHVVLALRQEDFFSFFRMLLAVSKEEIYSPEKLCLFLSLNICDYVQKKVTVILLTSDFCTL